jgi:hypothetical protein
MMAQILFIPVHALQYNVIVDHGLGHECPLLLIFRHHRALKDLLAKIFLVKEWRKIVY